jgi:general L-amino acid transport system permease protein
VTTEVPILEEPQPVLDPARGPWDWARKNLFSNWYNTVLSLLFGVLLVAAVAVVLRGLLSADYEIIRVNLRLFIVGDFPADQLWRPWLATYLIAVMIGMIAGSVSAFSRDRAAEAGLQHASAGIRQILGRFWSLIALVVVILAFTTTITPVILTIGAVAVGVGSYYLGRALPRGARRLTWLWAVVLLAGTYVALAGFGGVGWEGWGGLQLNLFLTVAGIMFAFPFGVLLALGRRSSLPVLRGLSVTYIELVRGVPLLSVLLAGFLALGFLIPRDVRPGFVTRILIAIVLFEAAYIAEVVRGGLQAVPREQVEAAQSLGLRGWATMRWVVLPQALRATIPAMVGQFISLFKDTTLVAVLGFTDLLDATFIVNSQPEFLGDGLFIVTLAFAGLVFWVGSYTLSRESRRVERRLGVGER